MYRLQRWPVAFVDGQVIVAPGPAANGDAPTNGLPGRRKCFGWSTRWLAVAAASVATEIATRIWRRAALRALRRFSPTAARSKLAASRLSRKTCGPLPFQIPAGRVPQEMRSRLALEVLVLWGWRLKSQRRRRDETPTAELEPSADEQR